jgi:hypothetical protein
MKKWFFPLMIGWNLALTILLLIYMIGTDRSIATMNSNTEIYNNYNKANSENIEGLRTVVNQNSDTFNAFIKDSTTTINYNSLIMNQNDELLRKEILAIKQYVDKTK